MMSISIIPLFAVLTMIAYFRFKSFSHPVFVFNLLWTVLSFLSLNNNLGYYRPSETIYGFFLMGGLFFNFGSLLIKVPVHSKTDESIIHLDRLKHHNKTVFRLELIILIYYLYKSSVLILFLSSGYLYSGIRDYYFSENNFTSNYEILFISYFADPVVLLTAILFAINIFKPLFSKRCSFVMLANVLLRAFISGGRTGIFELGVILVVSIAFFGIKTKEMKTRAFTAISVLVILAVLGSVVSVQRHSDEGGLLEIAYNNVVSYFVGSFSFFDVLLSSNDVVEPTYGMTTFGGISDIFIFILRWLGVTSQPLNHISVGGMLADFKEIGVGHYYNAMPTMYYYFYTDFREVGIFVFPFIFGMIVTKVYNKLKVNTSLHNFVIYILVMILVVESGFNWQFERVHYFMAMVYSYKLFKA